MKTLFASVLILLGTVAMSAHIMVSPPQSKIGASQRYELRVHNESTLAITAVELEIPSAITVTDIAQPSAGTYKATKAGDRIVAITWQIDVPSNKYLALPFTASNPGAATEVHWNVHEHLADGSVVEWSEKPDAAEKASVTRIG